MTNTATPAQINFLTDLFAKKVVPADLANAVSVAGGIANLDKRAASRAIDTLKGAAWLPRAPKAAPAPAQDGYAEALAAVENSRYAIPAETANLVLQDEAPVEGLLFVRVRTYNETRYLRRLHGSVGDFATSRLSRRDTIAVLKLIATDAVHYAQVFGEHFTVCGKCAAPLTDEKSRAWSLGPDCRKALGITE
jgi:hypothetical protein